MKRETVGNYCIEMSLTNVTGLTGDLYTVWSYKLHDLSIIGRPGPMRGVDENKKFASSRPSAELLYDKLRDIVAAQQMSEALGLSA